MAEVVEQIIELLADQLDEMREEKREKRRELEFTLKSLFDSAKTARQQSGIEKIWNHCSAILSDVDPFSAGSSDGSNWYKPMSPDGRPIMKSQGTKSGGQSDAVLNITESLVRFIAWTAREMAVPNSGDFWRLKPTPEGKAEKLLAQVSKIPVEKREALTTWAENIRNNESELIAKAQQRISDMLKEGSMTLEDLAVEVFDNSADMGTAVLCGPLPIQKDDGSTAPSWWLVPVDRIYPDPACGTDIRNGSYIFEGPWPQSAAEVRKLVNAGNGWIQDAITELLKEGLRPGQSAYEFFYFYGEVPTKCVCEVLENGSSGDDTSDDASPHTWISATICNDKVIRIGDMVIPGSIPYRAKKWAKWKRPVNDRWEEYWAGLPIPWKIRHLQKSLNIEWRALDNNTELSAVPQRVRLKGIVKPVGASRYGWVPGGDWEVEIPFSADYERKVQAAFMTVDIPCHLDQIRANIPLTLSMLAPITGIDDAVRGIAQGSQVGTMQVQLNAGSHLGKRETFYWQQLFRGMLEDAIRWQETFEGLDIIPAVEIDPPPTQIVRDIQSNAIVQFLSLSLNPAFGQDPALLADSYLLSNQFDPRKTKLTEERAQYLSSLNTAPPDEKAQAAVKSAELRAQSNVQAAQVDASAKETQTMVRAQSDERDRIHDRRMLMLEYKLQIMNYAMQKGIDVKTAMQELEEIEIPKEGMKAMMAQEAGQNEKPKTE